MARKPRAEWSDAYRRRIERAEAKGRTRQEARGHKKEEHKTRKPIKNRSDYPNLTGNQIRSVRAYLKRLPLNNVQDADSISLSYFNENGFDMLAEVKQARQELIVNRKMSNQSDNAIFGLLTENLGMEDADFLLFYHGGR
jgi:hypothetical protein